jgi:hypothetical protein
MLDAFGVGGRWAFALIVRSLELGNSAPEVNRFTTKFD